MSERYINLHFTDIMKHESELEARCINTSCTIESLIEDNRKCINSFKQTGEEVVIIDSEYEDAIMALLKKLMNNNEDTKTNIKKE